MNLYTADCGGPLLFIIIILRTYNKQYIALLMKRNCPLVGGLHWHTLKSNRICIAKCAMRIRKTRWRETIKTPNETRTKGCGLGIH